MVKYTYVVIVIRQMADRYDSDDFFQMLDKQFDALSSSLPKGQHDVRTI